MLILMKYCRTVHIPDEITYTKSSNNLLRGMTFPLTFVIVLTSLMHYCVSAVGLTGHYLTNYLSLTLVQHINGQLLETVFCSCSSFQDLFPSNQNKILAGP